MSTHLAHRLGSRRGGAMQMPGADTQPQGQQQQHQAAATHRQTPLMLDGLLPPLPAAEAAIKALWPAAAVGR